ncbi:MAG: carboxypeptidase regulatory-like domain-containing protein [Planctomycetes bacterium]|nr:carboxypeptidase regulatory-like domain-containing protein [Planctomycetota bacterium]
MVIKLLLLASIALGAIASEDEKPALITGVVHSARTSAPLHEYSLEIRAGGRLEHVTTDSKGRFTSALRYAPGRITVRPFDSEATFSMPTRGGLPLPGAATDTLDLAWKGAPLELSVACGPTFQLAWNPHAESDSQPSVGSALARLITVTPDTIDEGAAMETRVRVAADGRAWVRFGALPVRSFPEDSAARLEIVTADGLWKSGIEVSAAELFKSGALDLTWRPCGLIAGSVRSESNRSVPNAWVTLERVGATDDAVLERRRTRAAPDGNFIVTGLELGRWRLMLNPLRHHPYSSPILDLKEKPRAQHSITLDYEGVRRSLEGRAIAGAAVEGAASPPSARVTLQRPEEGVPDESVELQWRPEAGKWTATFVFVDLPLRRYELVLEPSPGEEAAWEKLTLSASPGDDQVSFHRR